jgi:hypothetical protein
MTSKQTILYWREFAAWKRAREARGLPVDTAARHALTVKALGYAKSSKALTNGEFDKVLMAFRAESKPDDLAGQIRLQEQAEDRRNNLLDELAHLALDLTDSHHLTFIDARRNRDKYLGTLSRSVAKKPYEQCSERELAIMRGILTKRLAAIEKKVIAAGAIETPENPF